MTEETLHSLARYMAAFRALFRSTDQALLTEQPGRAIHHPLWIASHLIWVLDELGQPIGLARELSHDWRKSFGMAGIAASDEWRYQAPEELLQSLDAAVRRVVEGLTVAHRKAQAKSPNERPIWSHHYRLQWNLWYALLELAAWHVAGGRSPEAAWRELDWSDRLIQFTLDRLGLDPWNATIDLYDAEETVRDLSWGLIVERAQVRSQIIAAFTDVVLGDGVGLLQGQGLDEYADAETLARYRSQDEHFNWAMLSPLQLWKCESSLSFFDAAGMRFHLPAYMLCNLDGFSGTDPMYYLIDATGFGFSRFDNLRPVERSAVRAYLQIELRMGHREFEHEKICEALQTYWTG
jgi:hypothetical protein